MEIYPDVVGHFMYVWMSGEILKITVRASQSESGSLRFSISPLIQTCRHFYNIKKLCKNNYY